MPRCLTPDCPHDSTATGAYCVTCLRKLRLTGDKVSARRGAGKGSTGTGTAPGTAPGTVPTQAPDVTQPPAPESGRRR